ncbi:unnamed protein product [[Candida] boidinii]|nr:unnamed protein product [[Candida] boidinii]
MELTFERKIPSSFSIKKNCDSSDFEDPDAKINEYVFSSCGITYFPILKTPYSVVEMVAVSDHTTRKSSILLSHRIISLLTIFAVNATCVDLEDKGDNLVNDFDISILNSDSYLLRP